MARRVIPCRVTDEYVRGAGVVVGAAGSHNDVALRLEFSPMWAGTARSIVWKDALGENATVTLLGTNLLEAGETEVYIVPIPAEAKALAGELSMTIKGATVSGETETSATLTTTAHFVVMESDWDEDAEVSGDITATQAEQLRAELEEIKDDIVSTAEAAVSAAGSASEAAAAKDAAVSAANSATDKAAAAETSAGEAGASASTASSAAAAAVEAKDAAEEALAEANGRILPLGGKRGEVLQKASDDDCDYMWGEALPTDEQMVSMMADSGLIAPVSGDGANIYIDGNGNAFLF